MPGCSLSRAARRCAMRWLPSTLPVDAGRGGALKFSLGYLGELRGEIAGWLRVALAAVLAASASWADDGDGVASCVVGGEALLRMLLGGAAEEEALVAVAWAAAEVGGAGGGVDDVGDGGSPCKDEPLRCPTSTSKGRSPPRFLEKDKFFTIFMAEAVNVLFSLASGELDSSGDLALLALRLRKLKLRTAPLTALPSRPLRPGETAALLASAPTATGAFEATSALSTTAGTGVGITSLISTSSSVLATSAA